MRIVTEWLATGALAAVALGACSKPGPTVKDTIAQHTPAVQARKAEMQAIMQTFSPDPKVLVADATKPFFIDEGLGSIKTNVSFMPADVLEKGGEPEFDLHLGGSFPYALAAISSPPLAVEDGEGAAELGKTMAEAATQPFFGVYRLVSSKKAELMENGDFRPGGYRVEAAILEFASKKLIAHCDVIGLTPAQMNVTYPGGKVNPTTFEEAAMWETKKDAMKNLSVCLTEKTGGTFQLIHPS